MLLALELQVSGHLLAVHLGMHLADQFLALKRQLDHQNGSLSVLTNLERKRVTIGLAARDVGAPATIPAGLAGDDSTGLLQVKKGRILFYNCSVGALQPHSAIPGSGKVGGGHRQGKEQSEDSEFPHIELIDAIVSREVP